MLGKVTYLDVSKERSVLEDLFEDVPPPSNPLHNPTPQSFAVVVPYPETGWVSCSVMYRNPQYNADRQTDRQTDIQQ